MAVTAAESHTLAVGDRPAITVRDAAGTVRITAGNEGQVAVHATKKIRSGLFRHADERDLERLRVDVTQNGNAITIDAKFQGEPGAWIYTIDLDITVPATADLDLQLAAGDTQVRGVTGQMRATVNAGNMGIEGVTFADGSKLSVNTGNITVQGALAAGASLDARINVGSAELRLPRETATHLQADARVGTISVSGWPVNVTRDITRQRAEASLGENPSGTLSVHVDMGSITLLAEGE